MKGHTHKAKAMSTREGCTHSEPPKPRKLLWEPSKETTEECSIQQAGHISQHSKVSGYPRELSSLGGSPEIRETLSSKSLNENQSCFPNSNRYKDTSHSVPQQLFPVC